MDTSTKSRGGASVPERQQHPRHHSPVDRCAEAVVGCVRSALRQFSLAGDVPWEQLSDDEKDARLHGRW